MELHNVKSALQENGASDQRNLLKDQRCDHKIFDFDRAPYCQQL